MKTRLLAILMLVITMVACKKQDNTTAKTGSSGAGPQSILNQTETCLTAVWHIDSLCMYSSGVLISKNTPAVGTYSLTAALYSTASTYQKRMDFVNGSTPLSAVWYVDTTTIQTIGRTTLYASLSELQGYIISLSGNKLEISDSPSNIRNGHYTFAHK